MTEKNKRKRSRKHTRRNIERRKRLGAIPHTLYETLPKEVLEDENHQK